ncbi:ABC transporter substrate-binding protein [Roseibium polysiphoniae]|uniref:ABC transporter substrate-binding protein n=1 Tax=Roseibium polysiphoniae TaxID=2571221 RepID=A0A944C9A0_9HYPH|nr:ABC transporter substrate-binding protein [Roseibium polysiphoniae]MBS8259406.1 ABC transporter substrate-binding protein [Roseibium polysiphoniae]
MKCFSVALALAAITTSGGAAQSFPLTFENCGHEVTFESAPESVVTIGQATTEAMYLLGLANKVSGTAVWFTDVLPEFADANAEIERLADNTPSFEAVVNKRPGLVASQYEWYVGPKGSVGTREQFHDLSVPTYIWPADCVGKDNTVGVDGTREELISTEVIYRGLMELSQIFGVPETGKEAVAKLQAREKAAIERASALKLEDVSAMFWFSSSKMDADPYVAGAKGAPGYIMAKLGVENVVTSSEEWPTVGWETLAKANPTYIVLADLQRRKFPADSIEAKIEFLQTDPVASQMDAVKNGRVLILDAHAMDATVRTVSGLELLAEVMEKQAASQ